MRFLILLCAVFLAFPLYAEEAKTAETKQASFSELTAVTQKDVDKLKTQITDYDPVKKQ